MLEEVLDMRPLSRAVFLLKATAAWPSASKIRFASGVLLQHCVSVAGPIDFVKSG